MRKTEKEKLEELTRELVRAYFVERDYSTLLRNIAPQISWFGTGAEEVCCSLSDAMRYLDLEARLYDGGFKVSNEWYDVTIYTDNLAIAMVQLDVAAAPDSGYYINIPIRFSIVYVRLSGTWKVCHIHNSVPYRTQGDASFFDRDAAEADYDRMKEMAVAVAEELIMESAHTDDLEGEAVESMLKAKLMEVIDDPQTIQTAMTVFDSYIGDRKALRRAQQRAGMKKARRLGRIPMPPPDNFGDVYERFQNGLTSKTAAARELGVSIQTFNRFCEEHMSSRLKSQPGPTSKQKAEGT